MKPLIIFGAPDHEEQAARKEAEKAGHPTATATLKGEPCHAGNAYKADGFRLDTGDGTPTEAIIFECGDGAANGLSITHRCDHHNPGDFGYGLPPERFWEASSIGQLCKLFRVQRPDGTLLKVAAGDHCPSHAYQGKCPGIDPEDFLAFRIGQKVAAQNPETFEVDQRLHMEMVANIQRATQALSVAPEFDLIPGVIDLSGWGEIPELKEAALSTGKSYLAQIPERDRSGNYTGRHKLVAGGNHTPESITEIMKWMENFGTPYGFPVRGFCGVVIEK